MNCCRVSIGILRKGFKISKSSSPEIMKSALPETASSKNLLSFGSRHSIIFSSGSTGVPYRTKLAMNCFLSSCVRYWSNFLRHKTSCSSVRVEKEKRISPFSRPIRKPWNGFDASNSNALIMIFVSKTSRTANAFIVCV